jgi:hypothetical protein
VALFASVVIWYGLFVWFILSFSLPPIAINLTAIKQ